MASEDPSVAAIRAELSKAIYPKLIYTAPQSELDQEVHKNIDAVLKCMSGVQYKMLHLRDYLARKDIEDKALAQWDLYEGYPALERAIQELEEAAQALQESDKTALLAQESTTTSLNKARKISIAVSNIAVFAMDIMNRKTELYAEDTSEIVGIGPERDMTVVGEISKLLKYSTKATHGVWSALDLIDKIISTQASTTHKLILKPGTVKQKWGWKHFLIVLVVLALFGHLIHDFTISRPGEFEYWRSPGTADNKSIADFQKAVAEHATNMHRMVQLQDERQRLDRIAFESHIKDIRERIDRVTNFCEANTLRIDNVWEALGPPNGDGKYFSEGGASCMQANEIEKEIKNLHEKIDAKEEQAKAAVKKVKDDWLRADVRLTRRMNQLERKN